MSAPSCAAAAASAGEAPALSRRSGPSWTERDRFLDLLSAPHDPVKPFRAWCKHTHERATSFGRMPIGQVEALCIFVWACCKLGMPCTSSRFGSISKQGPCHGCLGRGTGMQCLDSEGCGVWRCMGPRGSHKSVTVVKDWDLHALVRTQLQLRGLHDEAQVCSLLFDLFAWVRLL